MYSSYRTLFVTKQTSIVLEEKTNLVLSPEFYWVMKKELPVKHARNAKKLAPSLFEGVIPAGDYRYMAVQKGDAFLLFAYDLQTILEVLKEVCNDIRLIHRLYFVQNELHDERSYYHEDKALVCEEGIVLLVPRLMVQEGVELREYTWAPLSKNSLVLERYRLPFSTKTYRLSILGLLSLVILFGFEALYYRYALSHIEEERHTLFERYKLPSTSWQMQSIIEKHETRLKKQTTLREGYYQITQLSYETVSFSRLENDDKFIRLWFEAKTPEALAKLQKDLKNMLAPRQMYAEGMSLRVELSYE